MCSKSGESASELSATAWKVNQNKEAIERVPRLSPFFEDKFRYTYLVVLVSSLFLCELLR